MPLPLRPKDSETAIPRGLETFAPSLSRAPEARGGSPAFLPSGPDEFRPSILVPDGLPHHPPLHLTTPVGPWAVIPFGGGPLFDIPIPINLPAPPPGFEDNAKRLHEIVEPSPPKPGAPAPKPSKKPDRFQGWIRLKIQDTWRLLGNTEKAAQGDSTHPQNLTLLQSVQDKRRELVNTDDKDILTDLLDQVLLAAAAAGKAERAGSDIMWLLHQYGTCTVAAGNDMTSQLAGLAIKYGSEAGRPLTLAPGVARAFQRYVNVASR